MNPLTLDGALPPRASTISGTPAAPRPADLSRAQQTAALFTTLLESSMLSSVTAIGAEETEDGAPADDGSAVGDVGGGVGGDEGGDESGLGLDGDAGMPSIADLLALAPAGIGPQVQALMSAGVLGGSAPGSLVGAANGAAALASPAVLAGPVAMTPDPGARANAQTVAAVAREHGVDPVAAVAMMLVESGGNAHAVGDGGTSFGLFQLHEGGMLTAAGLSSQQAFDPRTNARVSLASLAHEQAKGANRTPGEIAAASQRPADPAGYALRVDAMMDRARALLGG